MNNAPCIPDLGLDKFVNGDIGELHFLKDWWDWRIQISRIWMSLAVLLSYNRQPNIIFRLPETLTVTSRPLWYRCSYWISNQDSWLKIFPSQTHLEHLSMACYNKLMLNGIVLGLVLFVRKHLHKLWEKLSTKFDINHRSNSLIKSLVKRKLFGCALKIKTTFLIVRRQYCGIKWKYD